MKFTYTKAHIFWLLGSLFLIFLPLCIVFYVLIMANQSSRLAANQHQKNADQQFLDLSAKIIDDKIVELKEFWKKGESIETNLELLRSKYPDFYFRSSDPSIRESETEGKRSKKISEKLLDLEKNKSVIVEWLIEESVLREYSHAYLLFVLSKIDSASDVHLNILQKRLEWEMAIDSTDFKCSTITTSEVEILMSHESLLKLVNSFRAVSINRSLDNTAKPASKINMDTPSWLMFSEDPKENGNSSYSLIRAVSYWALAWLVMVALGLIFYLRYKNKKAEDKLDIAATVAHEFRTPITSMSLMIEGLQEDPNRSTAKIDDYLSQMQISTQRLKQISELFFTEASLNQKNIHPEETLWSDWLDLQWKEFVDQNQSDSIDYVRNIREIKTSTFIDQTLGGVDKLKLLEK